MNGNMINVNGQILALWPRGLPRDAAHTLEAFQQIDDERVSSATGVLRRFWSTVDEVHANKELSEVGKKARIAEAAGSALSNLKKPAEIVTRLEANLRTRAATAVVLPKPDVNDTMVDLALAALVKSQDKVPTLLVNSSERVRVAIARMPEELTGLKPADRARIRGSLIDPNLAQELGQTTAAVEAARYAVQNAIDAVAPSVDMAPSDKAAIVGPGWRIQGVSATAAALQAASGER
ncbi:hypothetical protein [Variovorax guangxiensis]|uniref:hypothetical protein n=1 Tax=Variovorax guangxiensis TaxID=1775474 RepID=UPI0028604A61|nr:hypothetical protein [Variovorax guangxiensis]MDR6857233.1 hypothetical protein [Variovorax guangxiensis]